MSVPAAPGPRKRATERNIANVPVREHAAVAPVPIGPRVIALLEIAYRARRSVLLEGPTGIGKSQICAELAQKLGIGYRVLDLSLLEPPDLVGLPVIEGARTRYASPSELPTEGSGILMLEELNRAELPVMQPALQLLSARRLHAYELPPGWSCVAAINPEDGDYQVHQLDPALRSRFLQLSVSADRTTWLAWAERSNVHSAVRRVVSEHLDVFDAASPRSWSYASDVLHVLTDCERADAELLRTALSGYLPLPWAVLVGEVLAALPPLPEFDVEAFFSPKGPDVLSRFVAGLSAEGRIDGLALIAGRLRHALGEPHSALGNTMGLVALEQRLAALPGDLREQCLDTSARSRACVALLKGLGHEVDAIVRGYPALPVRRELLAWRESMKLHRIRLVLAAVLQHLERMPAEQIAGTAPALNALALDAGALAEDLSRWLRVRGLQSAHAAEPA
jgi:hypothetical protein